MSSNVRPLPNADCLKGRENYNPWKMQMEALFRRMRVIKVVHGDEEHPSETPPATKGGTPTPPDPDEVAKWEDKNADALSIIQLSIAPSQLWRLHNIEDAAEAWEKLTNVFEPSTRASKVMLVTSLFRLWLEEGASVEEHTQKFQEIVNSLGTLDIKFPDEVLSSFLLATLPDSFANFVTTLEARGEDLKLESTIDLLSQESMRRIQTTSKTAFAAQQRPECQSRSSWAREQAAKGLPLCRRRTLRGEETTSTLR